MGVYNDLANDAGYPYGTEENEQMANMIYWHEREQEWEEQYEDWLRSEIWPWLEWWQQLASGRRSDKRICNSESNCTR